MLTCSICIFKGVHMKLPLTKKERSNLRTAKVIIQNTAYMDLSVLAHALGSSLKRAAYIKALAQFQTVPSIGPKMAQCAVDLGYYSSVNQVRI